MGVITRAFTFTGTPTEAQWNVDIDAIISEITGQLDSANCDTTSSDAIMTLDVAQTKTARQTFSGGVILDELLSTANAGSGHVKIADIRWDAGGGSLADNDGLYLAFTGDDSGAAETEYMRLALNFDDVTATNEDASLVTSLMKAGTLTSITTLTNVALSPTTTDAVSLGTSSLNWSDLFLDSGAVINFDSGNVTLTHSSSTLTVSGNLSVGGNFDVTGTLDFSDSAITNAGDIQLDSITGDGDTDTSITFSGSNVITVKAANANQVTFTDGGIIPSADNDIDLGSGSYEFKDAYFDGTVTTDGLTVSSTTNLDGAIQVDNTITVGVDDTGHDVKFFGASAGAYLLYDESADTLDVRGATAAGAGKLKLTTGELTVVDGDILGRIDFQAPLEASGTDAVLVGASIWAEADDTFGTALNDTDLVFAVAESETAAERMRLSYDGTNVALAFTGGDLTITSGGGDISFDNENLSTTGTLASGALTVTGAASTTGNIHLHTNNTFFTGDSTGGGPWNLVGIDGSNDIIIGETSGALNTKIYGGQFSFIDTSTTRMTINGSGDVGISTGNVHLSTNNKFLTGTLTGGATKNLIGWDNGNALRLGHLDMGTVKQEYASSSSAAGVRVMWNKSRGTDGSQTAVVDNDDIVTLEAYGYNGSGYDPVAYIKFEVDGEVGTSGDGTDMPGRLTFFTTPNGTADVVERMRIDSVGDTYTNDGTISSLSDSRAKKDIRPFRDGLSVINALSPINYRFNGVYELGPDDGIERVGFAADEVALVAPYLAKKKQESVYEEVGGEKSLLRVDDVYTLSQIRMIPVIVNAIKELSDKVSKL